MKMIFVAAMALSLAACGGVVENAEDLRSKADAAIDEGALKEAVGSAVDKEAVEGLVHGAVEGAVRDAVREALPTAEIEAVGAVIDEEALAKGLDEAVDGEAMASAALDAIGRPAEEPDPAR